MSVFNDTKIGLVVNPKLLEFWIKQSVIALPICKHIAKATRANSQSKALSKSLQSRHYLPTGHWDCRRSKKQNKFVLLR